MTTMRNIVEEMRQRAAYCEHWQRNQTGTREALQAF